MSDCISALKEWTGKSRAAIVFDSTVDEFTHDKTVLFRNLTSVRTDNPQTCCASRVWFGSGLTLRFGKEDSRVARGWGGLFFFSTAGIFQTWGGNPNQQDGHLLEVDGDDAGAGEPLTVWLPCEGVVLNAHEARGQVVTERV